MELLKDDDIETNQTPPVNPLHLLLEASDQIVNFEFLFSFLFSFLTNLFLFYVMNFASHESNLLVATVYIFVHL